MLSNAIHEEEANVPIFNYMEITLQWLDMHDEDANFHLYFLMVLSKYLGFHPDTYNQDATYFDLLEGEFILIPSLNPIISGQNLVFFKKILGTNFDELYTINMGKKVRQELLKSIVLYFELHLQGFRKPKSLAVLNEVFN